MKMKKTKEKYSMGQIIDKLVNDLQEETIEKQLLRPKLIRELYKQLGEPKEEDFPNEYKIAGRCWKKFSGYTKYLNMRTARMMEIDNGAPTTWRVERPSRTKMEIVEEYNRAGWHCEVQAYNVLCGKYVKHPKFEKIWVYFYSSRDCNKYEYVIETEE